MSTMTTASELSHYIDVWKRLLQIEEITQELDSLESMVIKANLMANDFVKAKDVVLDVATIKSWYQWLEKEYG